MRSLLYAILASSLLLSFGQQKKLLQKADFSQNQLSTSWVIVKIKPNTSLQLELEREVKILHKRSSNKESVLDGMHKIQLKKNQDPIDFCNELLKLENVIYAEPIKQDQLLYTPSDPSSSNQTYLSKIKAFQAWDLSRGDDDITIGIIDTGIDLDHEDLSANVWHNEADPIDGIDNDENGYIDDFMGYDFADGDNDPTADKSGHGTEVSGVAGAATDNGIGISGIGFNTKIAALKGFTTEFNSSFGLYDAIVYAADNGIQVINLSWGSPGNPFQSEQDIINYAVLEKNVVVVAAAGNDGNKANPEAKFYPASYDNVLSVGATDIEDNRWSLSTYNHAIDLMAPGNAIYSTRNNDGYSNSFGTSLSAPMVSSTAALVLERFPDLSARQVMERVRVTADDIYNVGNNVVYDGKLGKGRLNVYRALAENNLKSLRVENTRISTSLGEYIFFGDTITVRSSLMNYLSGLNDPILTLSSEGSVLTNTSISPGSMIAGEEKELQYQLVIPETTAPESAMKIRIDIKDGTYTDFQYVEFTTSPDYVNFGNEKLSMTIAGNGNLGYADQSFFEGVGFQSKMETLMRYFGFFIATSGDSMTDNLILNYSTDDRSQNFTKNKNYKLYHHPGADFYGYSEFQDNEHSVIIEQSNLAWKEDDFIILRYRVINNSSESLSNVLVGIYADWNLGDQTKNKASYNIEKQYSLTTNEIRDLFAATQIIADGTMHHSNLDLKSYNENSPDFTGEFSDQIKFELLTVNQYDSAGQIGEGNDVSSLHGVTIMEIAPYESAFINVVIAVNTNVEGIENSFIQGQERLEQFITNPRVLETFKICDINQVSINPSEGINYEFYSDPYGQNLIATGEVFEPAGITSDSTFFVKNIDGLYPTDIKQVRLQLFSDISNFEMSTDTLYLDNATTNVVAFTDASLDAVTWEWDFDQGTISRIQNPSLSFSEAGIYSISLKVQNAIGCENIKVKNLVVANRPAAPSFVPFVICPNENIVLNDAAAEKLKVYVSANSSSYILGNNLELGPFTTDSIVYVSGIYDGFESLKTPVSIVLHKVNANFEVVQDTTGSAHRIQLNANIAETSTFQWFVNNEAAGNESPLLLDAVAGSITIRMEVESEEGCQVNYARTIKISSSPIPVQSDISKCEGESIIIRPKNGNYFGFYTDEALDELIKKGTQLKVAELDKIYIVGLDDGLPSKSIEVTVSNISFEVAIDHTTEVIGLKNKVSLSGSSEVEIKHYEWYINGALAETSTAPILFLDNTLYEVVLNAENLEGCTSSDTLILDFQPVVLGLEIATNFTVYPNPTSGIINLQSSDPIDLLTIHDLSGKQLYRIEKPIHQIDIKFLESGIYVFKAKANGAYFETSVLLKK
jgi:hypothetical protein